MNTEKKTVSVVVPIYNEEEMPDEIYARVNTIFSHLEKYSYELVFFDDASTDGTVAKIEKLCKVHDNVKCVLYAKNSGYLKNTFYSVQQAKGDCAIILHADLQNPPEKIPEFIEKWENGAQVVLGVKNQSRESKIMYLLRTVFYFMMIHIFGIKLIPHATEFELFDKSFIEILKKIKTSNPFLRGIVLEYAASTDNVYFIQDKRKKGRSKFNFSRYYDFAICGITQYSKILPRRVMLLSVIGMFLLTAEFFILCLPKLIADGFYCVYPEILIHVLILIGLIIIAFMAFTLEFIISASNNSVEKPLVIEAKRINY